MFVFTFYNYFYYMYYYILILQDALRERSGQHSGSSELSTSCGAMSLNNNNNLVGIHVILLTRCSVN